MIAKSSRKPLRMAALTIAALLACASWASARQDLGPDDIPGDPPLSTTWFTLPVRAGIFVALLIVAWAFGFYAFFPWILDRKTAMRPLQAYGLSAGLIWVTWCGAALLVFQDMLVLKSQNNDFVRDWMLVCVICVAALIGFVMIRTIFGGRSVRADS
jgi:threonine/homoserine/homoserine lactone efflux protein